MNARSSCAAERSFALQAETKAACRSAGRRKVIDEVSAIGHHREGRNRQIGLCIIDMDAHHVRAGAGRRRSLCGAQSVRLARHMMPRRFKRPFGGFISKSVAGRCCHGQTLSGPGSTKPPLPLLYNTFVMHRAMHLFAENHREPAPAPRRKPRTREGCPEAPRPREPRADRQRQPRPPDRSGSGIRRRPPRPGPRGRGKGPAGPVHSTRSACWPTLCLSGLPSFPGIST